MNPDNIIEVHDVKKKYALYADPKDRFKEVFSISRKSYHKDFYALQGISFDVHRGETVGIVGTNGSGKSTILKIITGVLEPTEGSVSVKGKISALLELGAGFNQEYTGRKNIFLNGRMMGISKNEMKKREQDIIEFAEIGDFIDQPVKTYSSGMFARLAFAVAINVEPDILIVDEALSVGDLFFQNKCFRKFDELKEKGVTIIFVSHDISSVRQMCSRVVWIEKGKQIIFDESNKVCDMYMDHKRKNMNELIGTDTLGGADKLEVKDSTEKKIYPQIHHVGSCIESEEVTLLSAFITDLQQKQVESITVEKEYEIHIALRANKPLSNVIIGCVMENQKGLPLYDFNNFINAGKTVEMEPEMVYEATFRFKLPRIMKGTYLMAAAVADGTQEKHRMLTWLHGVRDIEIVNDGFNSSYIEIPAEVSIEKIDPESVELREEN